MSYQITSVVLATFIILSLGVGSTVFRPERRPKIMGDKLPLHLLLPHKKQIQKKIAMYNNFFRSKVVPPAANMLRMKWHKEVAKTAQKWADECMFLTHDNITGRYVDQYGTCGQNIFVATHQVPWYFAIKTWWLEKDNFTYGSHENDLRFVGHYTALVWASSHEVGCGLSKCYRNGNALGKLYYLYVCNYCPIGNRQGHVGRPYRRGKPCGMCKSSCVNKKLCTNVCPGADMWANCKEMHRVWPGWLCNTHSPKGKERFRSCRATCGCKGKIHD